MGNASITDGFRHTARPWHKLYFVERSTIRKERDPANQLREWLGRASQRRLARQMTIRTGNAVGGGVFREGTLERMPAAQLAPLPADAASPRPGIR